MTTATAFNTTLLTLALKTAEDFLRAEAGGGPSTDTPLLWLPSYMQPARNWQPQLLHHIVPQWEELDKLIGHKAFVDVDPGKVNQWLASLPSIPLRFQERPIDKSLFYVATYFALRNLHWAGDEPAQTYDSHCDYQPLTLAGDKPAFRLGVNTNGVRFVDAGFGEDTPLVIIPTSSPRINIYAIRSGRFEEFDLLRRMQVFRTFAHDKPLQRWGGVILPNALVEQELDLGEGKLVGLYAQDYFGRKVSIFEAGMFLRLVLCPDGPMAEGAAKLGCAKESAPNFDDRPNYRLDGDFHFAFVDELVKSDPIVAAWLPANQFSTSEIRLADFEPKEE